MRFFRFFIIAQVLAATAATPSWANVAEPDTRSDEAFDFMNFLAKRGLHDLENEQWNAYGQLTWISSFKLPFRPLYTNAGGSKTSLSPDFEHSFTGTFSGYVGAKLWKGAEAYWVPEAITERPLSNLAGLGGVIQNFELQKQGGVAPVFYTSRLFLRQTFNFGGTSAFNESDPMQLAGTVTSRRVVVTIGNFSILDIFDKNTFAGDLRRQFFNMAFLTYAAYDFAADARGYTLGVVGEVYFDDWAFRAGFAAPPEHPNQLALELRFWKYFGSQLEVSHKHSLFGLPGAVRVLGYLNRENMGRFNDAVSAYQQDPGANAANCVDFNYGSPNASAPDLCWARRPNIKVGVGVNIEQSLSHDIGIFFRGMYSDGQTEVYSFTSTDRSISVGVLGRGSLWARARDYVGTAFAMGWISAAHANYLSKGGIDGFIGDGKLRQAPESVFEVFYGLNILSSVWLSADYQLISNPAYNADRGTVHIFGLRAHAEF